MAAATGIWNQHAAIGQHLAAGQTPAGVGATPLTGPGSGTGGTGGTSGSSSDSATISANDFLTLLVTEMQNQDPTADTDPNEYINQLVQVNSLEQLIEINQNLSTALGTSTSSSSSVSSPTAGLTGKIVGGATAQTQAVAAKGSAGASTQPATAIHAGANSPAAHNTSAKPIAGNLSVPEAKPAAHRVAQSLGGRPHPR